MIKTITTYSVCFTLIWTTVFPVAMADEVATSSMTEQQIRVQYPDAKIIHVEADDYQQLALNLRQQGYEVKSGSSGYQEVDKNATLDTSVANTPKSGDCHKDTVLDESIEKDSVKGAVDVTGDLFRGQGNGGGSGKGAVIIFVIIGAVLIIVWTLYVMKYLYDMVAGAQPCDTWYDFSFRSSSIESFDNQFADFNGLRFSTGFRDGNTDVGIAIEVGETDISLTEISSLRLQGSYWFIGPVMRWRTSEKRNPNYFHMSFMGGSTEHKEVGVVAKATLGMRFGLGENFHLGFSLGAMNINLNDNQGVITEREQFHYLVGINSGFVF